MIEIGVYLKRSSDSFPGHMGLILKEDEKIRWVKGFRFDPTDLPSDFSDPSKWRDFLFENCTPGYVMNDINLYDQLMRKEGGLEVKFWEVTDNFGASFLRNLPDENTEWSDYSFEPMANQAHNCVTWATTCVNFILGMTVLTPEQGRVKLVDLEAQPK